MRQITLKMQDGKCNMCGCRNGELQCTDLPACREEMDSDGNTRERSEEDKMCDECENMPATLHCSVNDGRTFPTLCHALRCQGLSRNDVMEGACSERVKCKPLSLCIPIYFLVKNAGHLFHRTLHWRYQLFPTWWPDQNVKREK